MADQDQPMFADAFQWHYPTPLQGDYLTVIVDLPATIVPKWGGQTLICGPSGAVICQIEFFLQ